MLASQLSELRTRRFLPTTKTQSPKKKSESYSSRIRTPDIIAIVTPIKKCPVNTSANPVAIPKPDQK